MQVENPQLKELHKTIDALRVLADEIEKEHRNMAKLHPRRQMDAARENRFNRRANAVLLTIIGHGGPADDKLRQILLSWRGKNNASWQCFYHVCETWKPIKDSRSYQNTSRPLRYAEALRTIADAVVDDVAGRRSDRG